MKPVEPPEYEGTQRLVWNGEAAGAEDLVVRYAPGIGESISVWSLSLDERRAILDGARIFLGVVGRHPPVWMAVEGVAVEDES